MRHTFFNIIAGLLISLFFVSCEDDKRDSLNLSEDVDIVSFSINGIEGTIDNSTMQIKVVMPVGASLNNLSPSIQLPQGATVTPASGQPMDFDGKTITYRVKNGDLFNDYKVMVENLRAYITRFSIGSYEGVIDQSTNKILVVMPTETDVKSLIPSIEYTEGAMITPANGTAVDFTNPATYSLLYQGETFTYQVTVKLNDDTKLPIVIYNGEDINPSWFPVPDFISIETFDNPDKSGINTSNKCISIWRNPGDDAWFGGGIGGLDIQATEYNKFSLMIWKETAGKVQLELQDDKGNKEWLKAEYSANALKQWQKLEYQIPDGSKLGKITTLLVAPHLEDTNGTPFPGQRMYWDNVTAYPVEN